MKVEFGAGVIETSVRSFRVGSSFAGFVHCPAELRETTKTPSSRVCDYDEKACDGVDRGVVGFDKSRDGANFSAVLGRSPLDKKQSHIRIVLSYVASPQFHNEKTLSRHAPAHGWDPACKAATVKHYGIRPLP
jgi:hypothetical protein